MTSATSKTPTVSIIVPVYNSLTMLPAALETVFNQTFQDFELILVDDGSTAGSSELLKTYESRARVLTKKNGGASSARNVGIQIARGEFVAFLDADDLWDSKKLELQVAAFREKPETGVCFTECLYFDSEKEWEANFGRHDNMEGMIFDLILREHFISTTTVMIRRDCLTDIGLFDETLTGCEDYNLFLRLAEKYPYRFLAQPLAKLRCHDGNLSNNLPQMCRDEVANLDKIAELYPERGIPKNLLKSQIYFRFGQYHFDANDFRLAKNCFRNAIRFKPTKVSAYIYLTLALLPAFIRNPLRNLVRTARGTQATNATS